MKFALIDTVPMQRRNLPEKKHSFHIWQVFAYLTFSLLNRFLLEVRSQGYSPLGWRALFASSFFGCAGWDLGGAAPKPLQPLKAGKYVLRTYCENF